MTKATKFICGMGLFTLLASAFASSSLCLGLDEINYTEITQEGISVTVGISPMVGLLLEDNIPGTGVSFSDGIYSKTMTPGEYINNFGTTSIDIICNTSESYTSEGVGNNCETRGWDLTATSTYKNNNHAAMKSQENNYIESTSEAIPSASSSNWKMTVVPTEKTYAGSQSYTPVTTFSSPSPIPAIDNTLILTGNSFQNYGGKKYYLGNLNTKIKYDIGVSGREEAGTYSGIITYTISLKASS